MHNALARPRGALADAPERACVLALAAFAAAWFAFLVASATATPSPFVLSDETAYLLASLFGHRAENYERWGIVPQVPNLLFFALYGLLPGPEIYRGGKLLNAGFIVAAALPAYATARIHLRPWQAAAFAAVVIAAPIGTFARYFMPESLFHFGFWCVVWILLRATGRGTAMAPLAAGFALGLLALVKPHALALAAAGCLYLLLRPTGSRRRWLDAVVLAATFYATRSVAARMLGGDWDSSLSGPAYGALLSASRLALEPVLVNALGHAAALLLLAGVPLAVVLGALLRDLRHPAPDAATLRDVALLALAALAATLGMTIAFSAMAHSANPEVERATRLHGRYYVHVLPLVMLAFAAALRRVPSSSLPSSRTTLLAFVGVATASAWILAHCYESGIVDYPDLAAVTLRPWGASIVVAAGLVAFGVALLMRRRGGPAARQWHAWPLAWWAVIALSTSVLALAAPLAGNRFQPKAVDRAMLGDEVLRGLRHRADGMVIGTREEPVDAYRVLFHLASMSRGRLIDGASVVDRATVPPDVKWLILLPGVTYAGAEPVRRVGPLAFVELRSP